MHAAHIYMCGVYMYNVITNDIHLAEWQAMCCFKELQGKQDQDECMLTISIEQFYRFYEVMDLRWKQVIKDNERLWCSNLPSLCLKTKVGDTQLLYEHQRQPIFSQLLGACVCVYLHVHASK